MKALFKACVGVVALLTVAGTAQAARNLGTLSLTSGPLSSFISEAGPFSDDFTFDVASGPLPVFAGGAFFNFAGTFSALNLTFGSTTYDLLATGSGNAVSLGTLSNGPYNFTVSGAPTVSSATYGVQVSTVPEPNVTALMLLGLGLVGFTLRTRSRRENQSRV